VPFLSLWCALFFVCLVNAGKEQQLLRSGVKPSMNGPGVVAPPSRYKGNSWRCRACVDVAQTWRETFPCAGNADTLSSAREADDTHGCGFTSHCDMFETPEKQSLCNNMKLEIRDDRFKTQQIIKGLRGKESYYNICLEMGKCDSPSTGEGSKCAKVMNDKNCAYDPFCKERSECNDRCYMCYWVVKTFPVFEEECYRGVHNGAAPPERKHPPGLSRRRRRVLGKPELKEGLGSPPYEPAPEHASNPAQLGDYCFQLWDQIEGSARDRYLISYKSSLGGNDWNAQTACQCMKLCPFNELEALDMMSVCARDELDIGGGLDGIKKSLFPDLVRGAAEVSQFTRNVDSELREKQDQKNFWEHGW
jgi:hypothetical protein